MRNLKLLSVFVLPLLLAFGALRAELADVLPETLFDVNGEPVSLESLEGKVVGIYFTASWCPPCRQFTPGLVALRDANNENFEVVLVGFDRSESAHAEYRENYEMQFPAVEFRSEASQKLAEKFGVRGIPHLAILGPDGTIISENATTAVRRNAEEALNSWKAAVAQ